MEAHLATEQSMICLTSLLDPSDLLRLAAIVKQKHASDLLVTTPHASVVGNMQSNYGDPCATLPAATYRILQQPFIRRAATEWLVEMNDSRMGVVRPCSLSVL